MKKHLLILSGASCVQSLKKKVLLHLSIKRALKKSVETYIKGTDVVTKYNVKLKNLMLSLQKNVMINFSLS